MLTCNNRKEIRVYGLDRIEDMQITDETFKMPKDFNAQDYFANIYGISIGTTERCQKIVIRANGHHKYYIDSLPLHPSQRKIEDCGEYADFEFSLVPTMEFIMRLLYYGGMIEVLEPWEFRKDFRGWVKDMYEIYKNDERKKTGEQ